MLNKLKNNLSVQQVRTLSFLAAIIFYLLSYIFYPKGSYPGRISRFLSLLGFFFMFPAMTYQIKKVPLKLHLWIENQTNQAPTKVYSMLILLLLPIILIGLYLSFKNTGQFGEVTKSIWGLQLVGGLLVFLTFSFWERRQFLKK